MTPSPRSRREPRIPIGRAIRAALLIAPLAAPPAPAGEPGPSPPAPPPVVEHHIHHHDWRHCDPWPIGTVERGPHRRALHARFDRGHCRRTERDATPVVVAPVVPVVPTPVVPVPIPAPPP